MQTVIIALDIEADGDSSIVADIVNRVLDSGVLQDAVNEYVSDDCTATVQNAEIIAGAADQTEDIIRLLDRAHAMMEEFDINPPGDVTQDAFNRIGCVIAEFRGHKAEATS